MASWTKTSEGLSVALLTPEEDVASTQARKNKDLVWAYFHVKLNFVTDRPGTWTAHLGEKIGDRLWTILKGGGCYWCDQKMSDSGNYETEIQTAESYISERTCKRLLSAMQYGVIITHGDGHRWIYCTETDESEMSLDDRLRKIGKPCIRSKCYGSVNDALDRIDGALKVLGMPSLLDAYEADASYDAWG